MKLERLISPWVIAKIPDVDITGLHNDSRQIKPGFLFCAYPGVRTDGRSYISEVVKAGAAAVIYDPENNLYELSQDIPCIPVANLSMKLAEIASHFYGNPSDKLTVIGVTGTNGKTTVAYQLAQSISLLGKTSAYVGTLGEGKIGELKSIDNTTPDALCLQKLLFEYSNQAINTVCLEVSSHALCQGRVDQTHFEQAIFTNLSHEHLDYHLSMEAYAQAKAQLFAYSEIRQAIINGDDAYSELMIKSVSSSTCEVLTYGTQVKNDVKAFNILTDIAGSHFEVQSPWGQTEIKINALGFFNIYNSLAIFSSLVSKGYPVEDSSLAMTKLSAVPGRMEVVNHDPYIVVDYAHTPDALESALVTLKKLKKKRLLVVIGCGGNRDKTKRPLMGNVAVKHADFVIFTNDNPRNEDPLAILKEMEQGIPPGKNKNSYYQIPDRKEAIRQAVNLLEKEDILLIAGKGHENYQQIGETRYPFSDQRTVQEVRNQ